MTAVQFFLTEIEKRQYFIGNDMLEAYNKALEMEKKQIKYAYAKGNLDGLVEEIFDEEYYNETYKKDKL